MFPLVSFKRFDGSVVGEKRFKIIADFNTNPDTKILLLTTKVGGLGINLASANVVIMFDHDYNPMNDL